MSNPNGRPPIFKTAEEMQKVIDEYFQWCDDRAIKIYDDKTQTEKMISSPAPYTMSGLARRLGFSRETLSNYKEKTGFLDTIKAARDRVEEDVESRMNDKHTFTAGLIFNAKNNFGWKDRSEVENTVILPKPIAEIDVSTNDSIQENQEAK